MTTPLPEYIKPLNTADFVCPVCLNELSRAMRFPQCSHTTCGACAAKSGNQCPLCHTTGEAVLDQELTDAAEQAREQRKYMCLVCKSVIVSKGEVNTHTCSAAFKQSGFVPLSTADFFSTVARALLASIIATLWKMLGTSTVTQIHAMLDEAARKLGLPLNFLLNALNFVEPRLAPIIALVKAMKKKEETTTKSKAQTNNKSVTILIDFDQIARDSADFVNQLITGITNKIIDKKFAPNAAAIRIVAYGVPVSFNNRQLLHQVHLIGIQTRIVSPQKKEETDRELERDAMECESEIILIISSDQDFAICAQQLVQKGKKVVMVHNAPRGTRHEDNLKRFATEAWRFDEFVRKNDENKLISKL